MRFLIDTNILIPLEPTGPENVEAGTAQAATFARLVAEGNHRLLLHPESARDIARDRDESRRQLRTLLASKYPLLLHPPPVDAVQSVVGTVSSDSHDWVDHHLLAAVQADAVDYLVTDDGRMRRKAGRLGISERVLSIDDAVGLLQALLQVKPPPPPSVELRPMHSMDLLDSMFDSLREDYEGFDQWFRRGARQGREGWLVTAPDGSYAGLCLLKPDDDQYGLGGKVLKVSTFKVAPEHQGFRYGELLLKTLFDYVRVNSNDHVWLTVFEHHEALIGLLEQFGFERMAQTSPLGELVYKKSFRPRDPEISHLTDLELHVRHGPPLARLSKDQAFIVPIQPHFHRMLFPDYIEAEPTLFPPDPRPFGNALRKAYLCNSPISTVAPGAALLFYRSHDLKAVTTIAVVDSVLRSQHAEEIVRFVGQRTVYSESDIHRLARSPVLAILFRQDRFLTPPVAVNELQTQGVILRPPQSIMTIRQQEDIEWLARRVGALC